MIKPLPPILSIDEKLVLARKALLLIEHATAPIPPDDGGYHENAYMLAVEALNTIGRRNPK